VIGTVQAESRRSAGAKMRRMFYTGKSVRLAEEHPDIPVEQLPVEPRPCNYAVWEWSKRSRAWCLMGRFSSPQEASTVAGDTMIVIDVCSDRMIWWRGDLASRAKPAAVPKLEIQKYTDA
jgi:hypothetical protein